MKGCKCLSTEHDMEHAGILAVSRAYAPVWMSGVLIQDSGKTQVPKLSTRPSAGQHTLRQLSVEILLMAGLQASCYIPWETEVDVYQSLFPQSLRVFCFRRRCCCSFSGLTQAGKSSQADMQYIHSGLCCSVCSPRRRTQVSWVLCLLCIPYKLLSDWELRISL